MHGVCLKGKQGEEGGEEGYLTGEAATELETAAEKRVTTEGVNVVEEGAALLSTATSTSASSPEPPPQPNAFSRILIKFGSSNKAFMLKLHRLISTINAKALLEEVENTPDHVIGLALLARRLTEEEQKSPDLDYISGFHFWDNDIQIMVVEGIADKGLELIWTDLKRMMEEEANFVVLYNSFVTFAEVERDRKSVNVKCFQILKILSGRASNCQKRPIFG